MSRFERQFIVNFRFLAWRHKKPHYTCTHHLYLACKYICILYISTLYDSTKQHKQAPSLQIPPHCNLLLTRHIPVSGPQHMLFTLLSNKRSIGLWARVQAKCWWGGELWLCVCMWLGPGFFFHPVSAQTGCEPPWGWTSGFIGSSSSLVHTSNRAWWDRRNSLWSTSPLHHHRMCLKP